jgi:hypothetical protein
MDRVQDFTIQPKFPTNSDNRYGREGVVTVPRSHRAEPPAGVEPATY